MDVQDPIKARIQMTALQLFQKYGFHKVSVDEIVRSLGISKKTLYKYFASKDELVKSIIEVHSREIYENMAGIVEHPNMSFFEKLENIMHSLHSFHQKMNPTFLKDLSRFMPEVHRDILDNAKPRIQENFRILFKTGVEEGIFRSDVDPDALLILQSVLMEKLFVPEVLANLSQSAHELHHMIRRIIFEGILTEKGRAEHAERIECMPKHHMPPNMGSNSGENQ